MNVCEKCLQQKNCKYFSKEMVSCDFYEPMDITNEEWFESLDTENKAIALANICVRVAEDYDQNKTEKFYADYWKRWLKEKR